MKRVLFAGIIVAALAAIPAVAQRQWIVGPPRAGGGTAVQFDDDVALGFGNTSAAPDCWFEWDTAGTDALDLICTDVNGAGVDGTVFSVDTGTDDTVFVGNISTVAGTLSAEQVTSTDDMAVTDLCDCGRATIDGQLSHETNTVTCATATDDFDINWTNGNIAFLDMEDCDQDANDVNAPTSAVEGSSYVIVIEQSVAGTEDLTWNAAFLFSGGSDPVLTQTNNARDVVTCLYVDSIYHCAFGQDYQ